MAEYVLREESDEAALAEHAIPCDFGVTTRRIPREALTCQWSTQSWRQRARHRRARHHSGTGASRTGKGPAAIESLL